MSREIKFRAWTHQNPPRQWFQKNVAITGNGEQMVPIGGTYTSTWHALRGNNEGLIIEQYTGLKDKNGKEIYEGDILNSPQGRCLCVWGGDGWVYQFKVHRTDWFDIVKDWHEKSEVIGNIHENPELLEKGAQNEQIRV